jgi:hypothetical protein
VWIRPQADNLFSVPLDAAPRLVHFDREGSWIKELKFEKTAADLLHQLRHSTDAIGRQWASAELARIVKEPTTPVAVRHDFLATLREVAAGTAPGAVYWRVRYNALAQLRNQLAPADPGMPATRDAATQKMLLKVAADDRRWLRAMALATLGLARDPSHAPLYIRHLRDPSDRVINAAAIALGKSGSPLAYDALTALPPHPSWKNQSLISALAGLTELGDARGATLALKSLLDRKSARWTLSTPVWDYRITAAQALAALRQGGPAVDTLLQHFKAALADNEVNDMLSNTLLLATLGDARAEPIFAQLRQRFAGDEAGLKATEQFEKQFQEARGKP